MERQKAIQATLTDDEVSFFHDMGFIRLRGILAEQDVATLRSAMDLAVKTFGASPNSYNVTAVADMFWRKESANAEGSVQYDLGALADAVRESELPRLLDSGGESTSRGNFLLDTGVWRRVPQLARFATQGKLGSIAARLLGVPSIRYYDDQLFIKEGGAIDRVAFHQDLPYFHLDGEAGCVFWIPLDSVKAGGGRIGYVPGSHKWQQLFKPNIFVSEMPFPGSEGIELPRIDADPEGYGVQYIQAEPGDVLIHHFLTVHASEGNRNGTPRRAFSLRYCDGELRYRNRPGAPPQLLHRADAKDGDSLDDLIHPIVWPPANDNGIEQVA